VKGLATISVLSPLLLKGATHCYLDQFQFANVVSLSGRTQRCQLGQFRMTISCCHLQVRKAIGRPMC